MINPSERRDEALAFVAVAILWVLGTMALLGPVALLIAGVTMIGALIMGWHIRGGLLIAAAGAGLGMLLWGVDGWLIGPINTMVAIYRDYLFDGQRWDVEGLQTLFARMLLNGPAWPYFAPLGIAAGGLYFTSWHICTGSQLKRTTQAAGAPRAGQASLPRSPKSAPIVPKPRSATARSSASTSNPKARRALRRRRQHPHPGARHYRQRQDRQRAQLRRKRDRSPAAGDLRRRQGRLQPRAQGHALCPRSGETGLSVRHERSELRLQPDGVRRIFRQERPDHRASGLVEDHYLKLSEGYMQMVFKVLEAAGVTTDLLSLADYMSTERLTELVERQGDALVDRDRLLKAIKKREATEEKVQSLLEEVWGLAESEIAHLLDTSACEPAQVLDLVTAVERRAVVYFCLPALQFPFFARLMGKHVVSDLKRYRRGADR